ncbi:methyl-accepting chemotaxis protein [Mycoplana sp. BE70]|uniref:methyl-accepting chemotaxis protein n=1 Tax=Mycoplana sp. BE70 TaxID=2817775 RepID=UPI002863D091|nr:methyl-accepting chemotaxis protein [Mycoplana sp. BE70]MDR6754960.1 methyl-accepting chemotaxis protein [Mycoplana sp. BE70]
MTNALISGGMAAAPSPLAAKASSRIAITIRATLLLILSAFGATLLVLASMNMFSTWDSMRSAQAMRTNNEIGDLFLASAGSLASERGMINTAFGKSASAAPETVAKIAEHRRRADEALEAALERLKNSPDFKEKDEMISKVRQDHDALKALRRDIDGQLAVDGAARNPEIQGQWVPTATALIMSSQHLRIDAQVTPSSALARTQIVLDLRQAIWVVSEYAGRERAAIGGAIARGARLDDGTLATLSEYRGRLEQSWVSIESYEGRDFADPSVLSAIAAVRSEYFGTFEDVRKNIYAASAQGREYPLTGDEWMASATKAIDGLLALSNVIGQSAGSYTQQIEDSGRNGFIASTAVLIAAVVLGPFAFWIVTTRVTRPIQSLTETMSRLANGDLETSIPSVESRDEIGEMARAVEVFREAGRNNRRLEAEAHEGRELTERERREREAQRAVEAQKMQEAVDALGTALGQLAEGNVGHRIETVFAESLDRLRTDFNQSASKLEEALRSVGQNAAAIHSGSEQIRAAADDLSKRTEMQAASVEETAAAIEQITTAVRDTSQRAGEAGGLVARAREQAERSSVIVEKTVTAMGAIETSSREINNIIVVIDNIAFQTNLLALNAGVEAARAGDAGKGFAVVAQEVRELAQRSAKAAQEIKALITSSAEQVNTGVALVDETGNALRTIAAEVQEISHHVTAIVEAAREQSVGLGEINTAVNLMDQGAQQNAAMVEQSSAASHSLASEAGALNELLARFRFGEARQTVQEEPAPAARSPARALIQRVASFAGRSGNAAVAPRERWEEF